MVGYLIKLRRWSLSESYQWVKERHHACVLNQGKLRRLFTALSRVNTSKIATGNCTGKEKGWEVWYI